MALLFGFDPFSGPILHSRKRASSNAVSTTAIGDISGVKRARLSNDNDSTNSSPSPSSSSSDNVSTSSSPPSLELSFESSSSPTASQTSSSFQLDDPTTQSTSVIAISDNNNSNNDKYSNIALHPTEYYTAISAAKARLQTAQLLSTQSQSNLSRALLEFHRSKQEVKTSVEFLNGVEKRWGVIDVDVDSSLTSLEDSNSVGSSVMVANDQSNSQSAVSGDSSSGIQLIEISQAGESIVNGRYNLLTTAFNNHNNSLLLPKGSVYIHCEGPFLIQNEPYDMVIFQKSGFGSKIRWCVGLVPCSFLDNDNDGDDSSIQEHQHNDQEAGGDRVRNFALAYIYYWMEMDAVSEGAITSSSTLLNDNHCEDDELQSSWGVCHGVRPLPLLRDVSGGTRKHWWQFWRG